jgi:quercetin dioxygenase-like cupin family protein
MATRDHPNDLRPVHRYITTHSADGKAVVSDAVPSEAPVKDVMGGQMQFSLIYTNKRMPQLSNDEDIQAYADYLAKPPAITIPEGTVCRVVDFPPDYISPMHRTVSLDYGVVLEGEVELVLDSGESRHLYRGDVVVQRGSNHAWRNVTPDKVEWGKTVRGWARMFYVLQTSETVTLPNGQALGSDEGGIDRG